MHVLDTYTRILNSAVCMLHTCHKFETLYGRMTYLDVIS